MTAVLNSQLFFIFNDFNLKFQIATWKSRNPNYSYIASKSRKPRLRSNLRGSRDQIILPQKIVRKIFAGERIVFPAESFEFGGITLV